MATEMNQKKLLREINRRNNEIQKMESLLRKASKGPAQTAGTGLSKGQRQRRNRAAKKESLPKGLPLPASSSLPRGIPVPVGQDTQTTVRNDEVVANILSSTTFSLATYPVNPGQASTFPWLSSIAKNWEKYHFRKLHFYFRSTVSGFADAGREGKVLMSLDFDSSDAPPATSVMMEACKPSDYRLPSESFSIIPHMQHVQPKELFVRAGPLPGSADIKTYDCAQLHVASEGVGGTPGSIVGQLRVAYDVVLSVPVLESETTHTPNFRTMVCEASQGTVTSDLAIVKYADTIKQNPWNLQANPDGTVQLPAGNYQVALTVVVTNSPGDSSVLLAPNFAASTRSSTHSVIFDNTGAAQQGVTLVWVGYFSTDGSLSASDYLSWSLDFATPAASFTVAASAAITSL